jgi:hypothetical protein
VHKVIRPLLVLTSILPQIMPLSFGPTSILQPKYWLNGFSYKTIYGSAINPFSSMLNQAASQLPVRWFSSEASLMMKLPKKKLLDFSIHNPYFHSKPKSFTLGLHQSSGVGFYKNNFDNSLPNYNRIPKLFCFPPWSVANFLAKSSCGW